MRGREQGERGKNVGERKRNGVKAGFERLEIYIS